MTEHEGQEPAGQPVPTAGDGLDPKVGGLLSYLLFGWVGGLIMFLTQKNPEVRFHGAQSILVSIALIALWIVATIVSTVLAFVPVLGLIVSFLVWVVLGLGGVALWIFLCIKGYNLEHFKVPMVGDMAEKWAAS